MYQLTVNWLYFNEKAAQWKRRQSASKGSSWPELIAKELKKCEYEMSPNLSVILKNDGTRAVTRDNVNIVIVPTVVCT